MSKRKKAQATILTILSYEAQKTICFRVKAKQLATCKTDHISDSQSMFDNHFYVSLCISKPPDILTRLAVITILQIIYQQVDIVVYFSSNVCFVLALHV